LGLGCGQGSGIEFLGFGVVVDFPQASAKVQVRRVEPRWVSRG
jgi:hypothetical protein